VTAISEQNLELLRRAAVLGNAGEFEALRELYHPDVEFRDIAHAPDLPEVVHGRDAMLAVFDQWRSVLGDWQVEVLNYIDADPWVICETTWTAVGTASGVPSEFRGADAYEVIDGLIKRVMIGFADLAAATKAIQREA
jgi:ketosteroid isomerase-like protein